MSTQTRPRHRTLLFWVALTVPAVAWLAQLSANFVLATYACANDRMWILHTVSAAALALAAAGVWGAYLGWQAQRDPGERPGRESRTPAAVTLLLAVLLLLAILANELSNWVLEPCT